MKANELRIGNLFEYRECFYTVDSITNEVIVGKNINGFSPGNFKPEQMNHIPLTEEWLLKFGFEKAEMDMSVWYVKNGITLDIVTKGFKESKYGTVLEYVHQLQNWYYANKGEEL